MDDSRMIYVPDCAVAQSQQGQHHVWSAIESLLQDGRWERNDYSAPECMLTQGNHVIQIELAREPGHIDLAHKLFEGHLSFAEVESLERLHHNTRGVFLNGRLSKYQLYLARNIRNRDMVAAYAGNLMDLGNGAAVFIGTYAATCESHQRLGLMREMFTCALMQAAIDADRQGEELRLVIGDCTDEAEKLWNKTGRKRPYIQTSPNRFREIPFKEPSTHFDRTTGEPAKGAGAVLEHLMVRGFGCEITRELIDAAVTASFRWSGKRTLADFDLNEVAFRRYLAHFDNLLRTFRRGLYQPGELCLFSADERAAARQTGCIFE